MRHVSPPPASSSAVGFKGPEDWSKRRSRHKRTVESRSDLVLGDKTCWEWEKNILVFVTNNLNDDLNSV